NFALFLSHFNSQNAHAISKPSLALSCVFAVAPINKMSPVETSSVFGPTLKEPLPLVTIAMLGPLIGPTDLLLFSGMVILRRENSSIGGSYNKHSPSPSLLSYGVGRSFWFLIG